MTRILIQPVSYNASVSSLPTSAEAAYDSTTHGSDSAKLAAILQLAAITHNKVDALGEQLQEIRQAQRDRFNRFA